MGVQFVTMAPSATRTAAGSGEAMDLMSLFGLGNETVRQLIVQSDVTAASGTTPTMTVLIEDSVDGGVTWNVVGTFAAQTAVSRAVQRLGLRGDAYPAGFGWPINCRKVRARWTVGGTTPNFTFSVKVVLV